MEEHIGLNVGPYRYSGDADRAMLGFSAGIGIERSFMVLISTAYDAGIIGSENNGIVVFDNDNRTVVLSGHARQDSGFFGPSILQRQEFARIRSMDWAEFSAFCRNHPNYRAGSVPDINDPLPCEGRMPQSDRVIFPDAQKPVQSAADIGNFSLSTRKDIVNFLSRHNAHGDSRDDFALSWSVKVYNLDRQLSKYREEFSLDAAFDQKWEAELDSDRDGSHFWSACESGMLQFTDGDFSVYSDETGGKYGFEQVGRSGGHLVLTEMNSSRITAKTRAAFIEWLEEHATDEELVTLYKTVATLDHILQRPADEVEFHMASTRADLEVKWKAEATPAP